MDNVDFSKHTSRRFNEELEELRSAVLQMGGMVQEQLSLAVQAVVTSDSELGLKVAHDDHKVNRMEVDIDEFCSHILVRRAPAAMDLRLIIAVIKTITDLERIGDEAEKIGVLAARLAGEEQPKNRYRELRNLGQQVGHMLEGALNAFSTLDVERAHAVVAEDEHVDHEYEAIVRQSITFMMEDPRTIKRIIDVMWAARALERIGDHCKNICEYVVFMVLGKDVRHLDMSRVIDLEGKTPHT